MSFERGIIILLLWSSVLTGLFILVVVLVPLGVLLVIFQSVVVVKRHLILAFFNQFICSGLALSV